MTDTTDPRRASVEHLQAIADTCRALLAQLEAFCGIVQQPAEAGDDQPAPNDADDMIDTWTAAQRFDIPPDTVRWLAREKGLGEKRGGRWLISVTALSTYQTRVKREK